MPISPEQALEFGIVMIPYRKDPSLYFSFSPQEFRAVAPDCRCPGSFVTTSMGTFSTHLEADDVTERVIKAIQKVRG